MSKNNNKKPLFLYREERFDMFEALRYYFISAKYLMVRTI